jgi:hypothetical protein
VVRFLVVSWVEVATCYIGLLGDAECQELMVFCHSLTKCG